MADTEEYFPRGGKKPTTTYFKQSGNFLGATEKGERKKKKQKKRSEDDDGYLSDENTNDIDKSYKNCAARLNYKNIKAGVCSLGRVRSVNETNVTVSLPGNMTGKVMACHVSEAFNKLLEAYVNDQTDKIRELPEMFKPGQYVSVKVLEVDGTKLMLSMMPQHVNAGRLHTNVQKGDILQAAVSSVEDHGYVMDIGIPSTRAFLPKSNTDPEVELTEGMVLWSYVRGVAEGGVVTLSSQPAALQRARPRRAAAAPLLPATPLYFVVDKPLDNGIEGHVMQDTTAYIQRQHVDKVNGRKPALGQKIMARVLYVMPTRNTPFLTMKDIFPSPQPPLEEEQKLKEGDIVDEAQVIRIVHRSVHFKLGGGCLGSMSLARIQVDEDLTDEDVVAKSYPIGSTHRVRVLSYNLADYVYVVSDRREVVEQRYFSLQQLAAGDMLDATVKTVADNHLMVDVGRLTGYVPHTHYSDAGVFLDPKKASTSKLPKKFKVGKQVRARVLVVDPSKNSLLLTLKPSLLSEELDVLKSYEDAQIGKAYTGFIRFIRDYVLVTFFNNVTAYVPRNYVTREPIDSLADAFHLGQIVTCTILKVDVDNKKMNGSLTTAPFWPAPKREITEKRKHNSDNTEVPAKKQKHSDEEEEEDKDSKKKKKHKQDTDEEDNKVNKKSNTDGSKEKKKRNKKDADNSNEQELLKKNKNKKDLNNEEADSSLDNIKESRKKKNKTQIDEIKLSEESDAIETDIHEDSDHVLTPQDLFLIDFSDCDDVHKCKKRVVSITKNINARSRRIDTIDQKISKIESKGLDAKNKKYHTAMHMEKLVIQERIKKLIEGLKTIQEKLNNLGYEGKSDEKEKKPKKNLKESVKEESEVKEERKKQTKERKNKEISVVKSLEPALEVPSAKDFWSASTDSVPSNVRPEDSSSSDEEETEQPKKKRKKLSVAEKLAKVRAEEEHVRELEQRAVDADAHPRSSAQFERAVLADPDNSQLWIAYMAFHLQATEIEKARAVARRALSTISFREERAKLDVWRALLQLENRFGTKESLQKTVEEALQMNDTYSIHASLLDMYVETGKQQELSALVELMLRRYGRKVEVYGICGGACFKLGMLEKARHVMQKAISVLDKKEHVSVLVQFALLERSAGERERAEAVFEHVLAVYPRRLDVCAAYIQMLHQAGDLQQIRQVMERMTSQKLPARKMKTLYKKWIEVEEKIGNKEKVEELRNKCIEL